MPYRLIRTKSPLPSLGKLDTWGRPLSHCTEGAQSLPAGTQEVLVVSVTLVLCRVLGKALVLKELSERALEKRANACTMKMRFRYWTKGKRQRVFGFSRESRLSFASIAFYQTPCKNAQQVLSYKVGQPPHGGL